MPHPGLRAIKYVYRYLHAAPVDLRRHDHGEELVRRDQPEGRCGRWDIPRTARVASGPMPEIDLAPRQQKTLRLALPRSPAEPGVESF